MGFLASGRGGYRRGRGHVTAEGGVATADQAARTSVGDVAVDEVAGGTWKEGGAAADEGETWPQSSRKTHGLCCCEGGRKSRCARFRREYGAAAGSSSSWKNQNSARTAVGGDAEDEATGVRVSGSGDRRRRRGHGAAGGCAASMDKTSSAGGRGSGSGSREPRGWLWAMSLRTMSRGGGG